MKPIRVSDLHTTDRHGSATIQSQPLAVTLRKLAETCDREGLDPLIIAFIGDIFDLLHSQVWLERGVRPWEPVTDQHKEAVEEIYEGIKSANFFFFRGLADIKMYYPSV